ncbi:hypothetical protein BKA70DRAFT_1276789 [Coprinopsis sp. MPI-PUGE-AT-0042]|nr:hypothetical protein BKA70DRAFT_1276789 [Coprinopsis sp. MPI-PUGE-AT-0042]
MKFTIVAVALACASQVAAQGYDRQDTMRNLARSLIEEYEDLLEERLNSCSARRKNDHAACAEFSCREYCELKGDKCQMRNVRIPSTCTGCKCVKS